MSNPSPSLQDGFHGARDAVILQNADPDHETKIAHVQATARSRDLLKRAGIKRAKTHEFYQVPVQWDREFSRYQLAPLPTA